MTRAALLCLLLALPATAAAVPPTLSNQGYLVDAAGDPLTGIHALTFSLYDDADATNAPLWTETISLALTDGSYSLLLGDNIPIEEDVLDQNPLFLALAIDDGPDMIPRYEVVSVPYAVLSETAFNVNGGTVNATSVTADSVSAGGTVIDGNGISVGGTAIISATGSLQVDGPPSDLGCDDGQIMAWDDALSTWVCAAEADPAFTASAAFGIASQDLADWDAVSDDWTNNGPDWNAAVQPSDFASWPTVSGLTEADTANWGSVYDDWTNNGADWNTAVQPGDFASWATVSVLAATDVTHWNGVYTDWSNNGAGWNAAVQPGDFTSWSAVSGISAADVSDWDSWAPYRDNGGTIGGSAVFDTNDGTDLRLELSSSSGTLSEWAWVVSGENIALLEPDDLERTYITITDAGSTVFSPSGNTALTLNTGGDATVADDLIVTGSVYAGTTDLECQWSGCMDTPVSGGAICANVVPGYPLLGGIDVATLDSQFPSGCTGGSQEDEIRLYCCRLDTAPP